MLRKDLRDLLKTSKLYRRTTIVSGVLLLMTFALPAWRILPIASTTPFIPLHYNVYMGIDESGPWQQVFVLPAIGLALLVINTIFQIFLSKREKVLSTFFAVATVATEAILLVSMVLIVLLNL
ncbi:MAG: hypothetical protein WCO25_01860 [Candidatus Uhrbacteria bacterium]